MEVQRVDLSYISLPSSSILLLHLWTSSFPQECTQPVKVTLSTGHGRWPQVRACLRLEPRTSCTHSQESYPKTTIQGAALCSSLCITQTLLGAWEQVGFCVDSHTLGAGKCLLLWP